MKRFSKRFYEGMNNTNQDQDLNKREGELRIDHTPEKNNKRTSDIGEYVDYEEINQHVHQNKK